MRAQVRALNEKLTQLSAKVAAAVPLPSNCTVVVIPAPGSSGAPASLALPAVQLACRSSDHLALL